MSTGNEEVPGKTAAPGSALTAPVQVPPAAMIPRSEAVHQVRLLRPLAEATVMVQAQDEAREFIKKCLRETVDYGVVPGVSKPSLLKPGAEKFNKAYGLVERFEVVEKETDHDRSFSWSKKKKVWRNAHKGDKSYDWGTENGTSFGLYRYVILCELVDIATGDVRGRCIGSCSTLESKYVDRPRDLENTIIKMAQKRAYVGASLLAHGLSETFTQDVEDMGVEASDAARPVEEEGTQAPQVGSYLWAKEYPLPDSLKKKYGGKNLVGDLDPLLELVPLEALCQKMIGTPQGTALVQEVQQACKVMIQWHEDQQAFSDDPKGDAKPGVAAAPTPAAGPAGATTGSTPARAREPGEE